MNAQMRLAALAAIHKAIEAIEKSPSAFNTTYQKANHILILLDEASLTVTKKYDRVNQWTKGRHPRGNTPPPLMSGPPEARPVEAPVVTPPEPAPEKKEESH